VTESRPTSENSDFGIARDLKNFSLSHPEIESIEVLTVRGTRLRFPEANQAAPSFVPVHAVNGTFSKPYTSAEDLIPILQNRGLNIPNPADAIEWLKKVGYYRLSGYGLHFRLNDPSGTLTDAYRNPLSLDARARTCHPPERPRVKMGGHTVLKADVRRRFARGRWDLIRLYARRLLFTSESASLSVFNQLQ
jgi:hypothetical protein